jgi:hypothetical protein
VIRSIARHTATHTRIHSLWPTNPTGSLPADQSNLPYTTFFCSSCERRVERLRVAHDSQHLPNANSGTRRFHTPTPSSSLQHSAHRIRAYETTTVSTTSLLPPPSVTLTALIAQGAACASVASIRVVSLSQPRVAPLCTTPRILVWRASLDCRPRVQPLPCRRSTPEPLLPPPPAIIITLTITASTTPQPRTLLPSPASLCRPFSPVNSSTTHHLHAPRLPITMHTT